jgi:hypothetical protein
MGNGYILECLRRQYPMHVKGTFFDPRLKQGKFPVGAKGGVDNLRHSPDVNTAKLAD